MLNMRLKIFIIFMYGFQQNKNVINNSEIISMHAYVFNDSCFDIGTINTHTEVQECYNFKLQ
jgi:hypothetical protein